MGKGSNTSTTTSQPPQNFESALTGALNNTVNTAATPYQPYTGNLQAPFSPDQQAGFGMIENAAGSSSPYFNSAANYIDRSTAPLQPSLQPYQDAAMQQYQAGTKSTGQSFAPYAQAASDDFNRAGQQLTPQQYSAQAIQNYQNPYTQSVVDATQAQFNNQNKQQFNQLQGNAASAGALGGDRVGVAQGVMAGQQAAAQNPVIAGLYNQGFNQAQQEFNQQQGVNLGAQAQSQQLALAAGQGMTGLGSQALQSAQGDAARNLQAGQGIAGLGAQNLSAAQAQAWLNSQAGFGMSSLGNQVQNSQLQSGQALLGAGNQQQAQAQTGLNIPYQQYQAQQSYPFQVGNWLNSGVEGLSATAGGSGVSTTPGPSPFSQAAGLGIAGAGIYGAAGGFNSSGAGSSAGPIDSGTFDSAAAMNSGAFGEATGGRVIRRAPGGAIPGFGPPPIQVAGGSNGVPDVSAGYLPASGDVAVHTSGAPKVTSGPAPESTLGSLVRTGVDVVASIYGTPAAGIASDYALRSAGVKRGGAIHGFAGGGVTVVPSSHTGGVGVPQITGFGGGSSAPVSTGGLDKYLSDTQATGGQRLAAVPLAAPKADLGGFNIDQAIQQLNNLGFRPDVPWVSAQALPSLSGDGGGMKRGGFLRGFADGGSPDDSDIPLPPPDPGFGAAAPAAPAPSSLDAVKRLGDLGSKIHDVPSSANPWLALMTAGFGIAAGKSPHALENIGAGALQGVQQYTSEDRAAKQLASKVDEARAHLSLGQAQAEQTGAYQQGELTARQKQLEQTGELTKAQMEQAKALKQAEMGQALAMHNSSLGQAASLAKMHLGFEQQQLAEQQRFHDMANVPPELREFTAVNAMPPEQQAAYQKYITDHGLAQKGIPDIFGGRADTPVGAPSDAPPAGSDGKSADATPTGRNDAFLAKLSPQYQGQVKALVDGRVPFPTRPSPLQQQLIAAASQYDPTFDASDYNKRAATAKDFASGQSAKNITAINTAMNHLSSLQDSVGALGNGRIPMFNAISNRIGEATGAPEPLAAKVVRDSVASEMRKVFAGTSGGSLEELKNWESNFPVSGSPAQIKSALDKAVELMDGRLTTLSQQYSNGMGTNRNGTDLLSPEAKAAYQKLTSRQPESATPRPPVYSKPAGQQPFQAPVDQGMPRVSSPDDARKLPSGTHFLDPNGIMRVVP